MPCSAEVYWEYMSYQSWIVLLVILVAVAFFLFLNGGLKGSVETLRDVFHSSAARSFLFLGIIFAALVVFGAGIVRDGLTIKDILFIA